MEDEKPSTVICTVVAMDHTSFCYRVCSVCERTLPENSTPALCKSCDFNVFNPGSSSSKRLYRVLCSVATDEKVFVVICFDRAARVLFGCSADEFFDFAKLNPFAGVTAGKVLEGEMFRMTLSKPRNGNARHLRVTSVVPLRSNFRPAIETLKSLYGVGAGISSF
ncbi:PREDICTED: uncharacterized protein LOC104604530 [Nelumbo nucifera]|uniref:Replication factor A C-terminal domain-containing protein n=2 Tax=Nelumbo nucifera TaxID=4432 RepID=A0A823A4K3_NELNU|nr:PREDICTED: uncharacterized protein LOC104604530 [Nelumbo nucifera]DAD48828.1 TPA_asm: hypothetical protein HUJ06_018765 [Nelumbo nucifera]